MTMDLGQRISTSLNAKRHFMQRWRNNISPADKQIRLCEAHEAELQAHLDIIDGTLERIDQGRLGICEVCQGGIETEVLEVDYTTRVCLGDLTDEARHKLETELSFSQAVQQAFLPQHLPDMPGLQLSVYSRPAQILSGDYYDFFQFQDGSLGVAIADVAGHGVAAGLLMSSLQTSMRTLAQECDSPADTLQRVNDFFIHNINLTTFVTIFLGRFDPRSGRFNYANAGHNPPLLVHIGRENVWLKPTGAAIGLLEDFQITVHTIPLLAGDTLLFYTDGITEAVNASTEQFGSTRLAQLVNKYATLSADDLVKAVIQAVNEFTANSSPADDTTVLAFKVAG